MSQMKYTFVSLGKMESLGFRFGGPGLGNLLFPWARSLVYARDNNLLRVKTTWRTFKLGTFIRNERDKRMYLDIFTGDDGITGFKKFWLLNFTNHVKYFSGMEKLFQPFKYDHGFIKSELLKITNPYYIRKTMEFSSSFIGVHIRLGDFKECKNEDSLRSGSWNYRIPIRWYKEIINKIRCISDMQILIFSDVNDLDLESVLGFQYCKRVYCGSAISDMIALSRCKFLVASGSTFSMWASFLGQIPTIWFPGQMREKILIDEKLFEGEIDYNESLPNGIIQLLKDD